MKNYSTICFLQETYLTLQTQKLKTKQGSSICNRHKKRQRRTLYNDKCTQTHTHRDKHTLSPGHKAKLSNLGQRLHLYISASAQQTKQVTISACNIPDERLMSKTDKENLQLHSKVHSIKNGQKT